MARLLIFVTLLICLCYIYQVNARPQDKPAGIDLSEWGEKAKEMWTNMKKQVEDAANNPTIKEAIENTNDFFKKTVDDINKKVDELKEKL